MSIALSCVLTAVAAVAVPRHADGLERQVLKGAIRTYKQIAQQPRLGLDHEELHRALKKIGISSSSAGLDDMIGDDGQSRRLKLREFIEIIHDSPKARVCLALDQSGDIRRRIHGLRKLNSAGQASIERKLHYFVGLPSVYFAIEDFGRMALQTLNPEMHAISAEMAVVHGVVHSLTAILSLPRFHYKFDRDRLSDLVFSTARDAGMFPAFLSNLWYTMSLAGEATNEPGCEMLHLMRDGPAAQAFAGLGCASMFFLAYSTWRSATEDGKYAEKHGALSSSAAVNALFSVLLYTIIVVVDFVPELYITSGGASDAWTTFSTEYPVFHELLRVNHLASLAATSLMSLGSTAELYGVVTKKWLLDVSLAFTFIQVAYDTDIMLSTPGLVSAWWHTLLTLHA